MTPGHGQGQDVASAARAAFPSLEEICPFCKIIENDSDLRRGDFPFAALLHDLALLVNDLPEFGHRELLEDERLPILVAEFLD